MELKDKNLTVVFTVNDKAAFDEVFKQMQPHMKYADGEKWAITAWSRDHEIHRLGLIEEAAEIGDCQLIQDIIGLINVSDYKTLDDVRNRKAAAVLCA